MDILFKFLPKLRKAFDQDKKKTGVVLIEGLPSSEALNNDHYRF